MQDWNASIKTPRRLYPPNKLNWCDTWNDSAASELRKRNYDFGSVNDENLNNKPSIKKSGWCLYWGMWVALLIREGPTLVWENGTTFNRLQNRLFSTISQLSFRYLKLKTKGQLIAPTDLEKDSKLRWQRPVNAHWNNITKEIYVGRLWLVGFFIPSDCTHSQEQCFDLSKTHLEIVPRIRCEWLYLLVLYFNYDWTNTSLNNTVLNIFMLFFACLNFINYFWKYSVENATRRGRSVFELQCSLSLCQNYKIKGQMCTSVISTRSLNPPALLLGTITRIRYNIISNRYSVLVVWKIRLMVSTVVVVQFRHCPIDGERHIFRAIALSVSLYGCSLYLQI